MRLAWISIRKIFADKAWKESSSRETTQDNREAANGRVIKFSGFRRERKRKKSTIIIIKKVLI